MPDETPVKKDYSDPLDGNETIFATLGYLSDIPGAVGIEDVDVIGPTTPLEKLTTKLKEKIELNKKVPNHVKRVAWVPHIGVNQYGFVVVDLEKKQIVLGEPMAKTEGNSKASMDNIKTTLEKEFSGFTISENTTKIQDEADINSCGRLSAKMCDYLCRAEGSISDAINPENLSKQDFAKILHEENKNTQNGMKTALNNEIYTKINTYTDNLKFNEEFNAWISNEFKGKNLNVEVIDCIETFFIDNNQMNTFRNMIKDDTAINNFKTNILPYLELEEEVTAEKKLAIHTSIENFLNSMPTADTKTKPSTVTPENTTSQRNTTERPSNILRDDNEIFKKVKTHLENTDWRVEDLKSDQKNGAYRTASKNGKSFDIYVNKISTNCDAKQENEDIFVAMLTVFKDMHDPAKPRIDIEDKDLKELWLHALKTVYGDKANFDFNKAIFVKEEAQPLNTLFPS